MRGKRKEQVRVNEVEMENEWMRGGKGGVIEKWNE